MALHGCIMVAPCQLTLSAPPDATRDPIISTHVMTSLWWSTLLSMHVPRSRLHTMSCRSSPPDTISGMGLVCVWGGLAVVYKGGAGGRGQA